MKFKPSSAFKLKSGNVSSFKAMGSSPNKQTKSVAGEGTGKVAVDKNGNKYALYGGRRADLGEVSDGYGGGINPYTSNPAPMPSDTIFVGDNSHLISSMPWVDGKPDNKKQSTHKGDDFIGGGDWTADETVSSKKRTKGPKSYKTKE